MSRFIMEHVEPGTKIYTDEALVYKSLPNQEAVRHGSFEYVRGQAHTNGTQGFLVREVISGQEPPAAW